MKMWRFILLPALVSLPGSLPVRAQQETEMLRAEQAPRNAVWLESVDLGKMKSLKPPLGYPARARQSVAGGPLTLNGVVYPHGVGSHSDSKLIVDLHGEAERFLAMAGVDDARLPLPKPLPGSFVPRGLQRHPGTATFQVWVDGKEAVDTGMLQRGHEPKPISIDLHGARRMTLIITDGGRWPYNNPADWAGAMILMRPGAKSKPEALAVPAELQPPIASGDSPRPAIHGPRVTGASPGRPFLFKIPATGEGPLRYAARNLPAGLKLDSGTGLITGTLQRPGTTVVQLEVSGPRGKDTRSLTIVGAVRKLALTPPLGWNSWNVWAAAVNADKIRQAADWMVKSGLAAHGFVYINIDDAWMDGRGPNGEIRPNAKFPDMRALADYVHSKGLKLGLYSSPGPKTCQRLEGSYQHEEQDAMTYSKWGIDFLKYDLCSYGQMLPRGAGRDELIKPYRVMGNALLKAPRDLIYSLCEYGRGDVWEWGPEVGGQLWRTTGDIRDSWESMSRIGFSQNGLEKWAGPGHWNDPDMLVLGKVGWGVEPHPTRLTPNEQVTHITLWSLLSAPMLLGCDLSQLDKFTIDLLTNDEVLDVNQDSLGKQAARRAQDGLLEVWTKPLSDGTVAAGLFNRGIDKARVTAKWTDMGIHGKQPVRDLWQRKNLGQFDSAFSSVVPAHGAVLVRIGTPKRSD
jgi:alpha-galactosidase